MPMPDLTVPKPTADLGIIEQVLRGEPRAFETLMRRYNRLVFRTVRSIARSDAEAEDVAQEAWIAAYRNLAQFEGRAAFPTWVMRIAVRLAVSRTRAQLRFEPLEDLDRMGTRMDTDGAPEDPASELQRRQLAAVLEQAIDELPVDYRVVLVLRDVEQRSTTETAEALGVSEENVRVRLHRSRAALRARLHREFDGGLEDVFAFDGERCDRLVSAVMAQLRG